MFENVKQEALNFMAKNAGTEGNAGSAGGVITPPASGTDANSGSASAGIAGSGTLQGQPASGEADKGVNNGTQTDDKGSSKKKEYSLEDLKEIQHPTEKKPVLNLIEEYKRKSEKASKDHTKALEELKVLKTELETLKASGNNTGDLRAELENLKKLILKQQDTFKVLSDVEELDLLDKDPKQYQTYLKEKISREMKASDEAEAAAKKAKETIDKAHAGSGTPGETDTQKNNGGKTEGDKAEVNQLSEEQQKQIDEHINKGLSAIKTKFGADETAESLNEVFQSLNTITKEETFLNLYRIKKINEGKIVELLDDKTKEEIAKEYLKSIEGKKKNEPPHDIFKKGGSPTDIKAAPIKTITDAGKAAKALIESAKNKT